MKLLRPLLVALVLAVATYGLFAVVTDGGFVSWDDPVYVTENEHVRRGLDAEGLRWAFGLHGAAGNWHPLTWLSHMLDVELGGLEPAFHHRTSALLHAANAALAFLALLALTRSLGASLVVALLFAWHPLRVESVAWISERKDVLSGLFALLTLLAYAGWARRGSRLAYLAAVVCFALGLMAKPMLVTLPFVLLLLDAWPLQRLVGAGEPEAGAVPAERRRPLALLVAEKLPLFALAGASALLTVVAQSAGGAVRTMQELSLADRLLHVPVAYLRYLELSFAPRELACFYPHPAVTAPGTLALTAPGVLGGLAVLFVVTAACLAWRRRRPWLAVGWLAFLGMLVPVIGIVQVGAQSIADRYTYLPGIGLALAVVFQGRELWSRNGPVARGLLAALSAVALLLLARATRAQCATWQDSGTLFAHALEVTENNYKAHNSYGIVLEQAGEIEAARSHYEAALAIRPTHPQALTNLGKIRHGERDVAGAEELFQQALEVDPDFVPALGNLAALRLNRGDYAGGIELLERALAIEEAHALHHHNLGRALQLVGRREEAQRHLERAAELDPRLGSG